jgi:hypothetical protein
MAGSQPEDSFHLGGTKDNMQLREQERLAREQAIAELEAQIAAGTTRVRVGIDGKPKIVGWEATSARHSGWNEGCALARLWSKGSWKTKQKLMGYGGEDQRRGGSRSDQPIGWFQTGQALQQASRPDRRVQLEYTYWREAMTFHDFSKDEGCCCSKYEKALAQAYVKEMALTAEVAKLRERDQELTVSILEKDRKLFSKTERIESLTKAYDLYQKTLREIAELIGFVYDVEVAPPLLIEHIKNTWKGGSK